MSEAPLALKAIGDEPDEEVVEKLEYWLKMAESGKLRTVMLVGDVMGNSTRFGSAGDINLPGVMWNLKVIERHLMSRWDEGSEDVYYEDEE